MDLVIVLQTALILGLLVLSSMLLLQLRAQRQDMAKIVRALEQAPLPTHAPIPPAQLPGNQELARFMAFMETMLAAEPSDDPQRISGEVDVLTKALSELPPSALERLESIASEQGVSRDEMAIRLVHVLLERFNQEPPD